MNIYFIFIDFFIHIHCIIATCQHFLPKASKHSHLSHNLHNQRNLQKVHSAYLKVERLFTFRMLSSFKTLHTSPILLNTKNFQLNLMALLCIPHWTSLHLSIDPPGPLLLQFSPSPSV